MSTPSTAPPQVERPPCPCRITLFRKRQCPLPTWQGWLVILGSVLLLSWFLVRNIYSFLAMTAPISSGDLVVEGWATDYTMRAVLAEFNRGGYGMIYVIGGPLEHGASLERYRNYADLGRAVLLAEGAPTNKVVAVPTPPVAQDRTYASAKELRHYFEQHGGIPSRLHLLSEGTHARRSMLMIKAAMKDASTVGVTSVQPANYDPRHWWRSSEGVKTVMSETFSYLYTKILFHPR